MFYSISGTKVSACVGENSINQLSLASNYLFALDILLRCHVCQHYHLSFSLNNIIVLLLQLLIKGSCFIKSWCK